MEEKGRIIKYAPVRMKEMLESVWGYNSGFSSNKKLLRKILFAMIAVDRKFFSESEGVYDDNAILIGKGQTISQPSTVARMLLLADLQEGDKVLEIGTGSGWNACLIGFLVYPGNVVSMERIGSLVEKAQENVAKLRNYLKQAKPQEVVKLDKINFLAEDIFSKGKMWKKKYDKIIITAGIADKKTEKKIEELAKNLLRQNGLLICPYTSGPLVIYRKKGKLKKEETKEQYVFVPLLNGLEK